MSNFIDTGRNWSAPAMATFGYLSGIDGIENSWDDERTEYRARTRVGDWFNGRERGFSLLVEDARYRIPTQVFIVYEHRGSDTLCILHYVTEGSMMNPPTLQTLPEGLYNSSSDYTKGFDYTESWKAAQYIIDKFRYK